MNKTSKLFCAAILLLSVTCKDAPMTEPSPYANLEYVYQKQGGKNYVGLQDTTGKSVIPIQYDSIRPGFGERFLIAWRDKDCVLYAKRGKTTLENGYDLIGKVVRIGKKGIFGAFYRVNRSNGDICVYEMDTDIYMAIKRYQKEGLVILEAESEEMFRFNPSPRSSDLRAFANA